MDGQVSRLCHVGGFDGDVVSRVGISLVGGNGGGVGEGAALEAGVDLQDDLDGGGGTHLHLSEVAGTAQGAVLIGNVGIRVIGGHGECGGAEGQQFEDAHVGGDGGPVVGDGEGVGDQFACDDAVRVVRLGDGQVSDRAERGLDCGEFAVGVVLQVAGIFGGIGIDGDAVGQGRHQFDVDVIDGDGDQVIDGLAGLEGRGGAGDGAAGVDAVVEAALAGAGEGDIGVEGVSSDHVEGDGRTEVGDFEFIQEAFGGTDRVLEIYLGDLDVGQGLNGEIC